MLGSVMTHSINVAPIYLQNWTLSESMNILQVSLSLSFTLYCQPQVMWTMTMVAVEKEK